MKTETYVCQACSTTVERPVARGQRPKWCPDCRARGKVPLTNICPECGKAARKDATYCSRPCAATGRTPRRPQVCILPDRHPARRRQPSPRLWVNGKCVECEAWFTTRQPATSFCSRPCSKRYWRRDWKEKSNRIVPRSVRLAVYIRDQGICQLCHEPVDMTAKPGDRLGPTVDHIVPQSLTLMPDHSEANLRLAHMICNARRGAAAA